MLTLFLYGFRSRVFYWSIFFFIDFVEYLPAMIGPVEWVDWPIGIPRNLRFLRVKVWINPLEPLFMGFSLKMDDDTHVWLQCKYERVFRLCFSCGCIGHKVNTCTKSPQQISIAMQRQVMRIRSNFGVRIAVDINQVRFVNDAKAFAEHPLRRTS